MYGYNWVEVFYDLGKNVYRLTVFDRNDKQLDQRFATGSYDPTLLELINEYECGSAKIMGSWGFYNVEELQEEDEEPDYGQDGPYNGWANRATWNVVLWLLNDEETYHWLRVNNRFINSPDDAQKWIREFWGGGVTPDDVRLTYVNWNEVYAAIEEDRS